MNIRVIICPDDDLREQAETTDELPLQANARFLTSLMSKLDAEKEKD